MVGCSFKMICSNLYCHFGNFGIYLQIIKNFLSGKKSPDIGRINTISEMLRENFLIDITKNLENELKAYTISFPSLATCNKRLVIKRNSIFVIRI